MYNQNHLLLPHHQHDFADKYSNSIAKKSIKILESGDARYSGRVTWAKLKEVVNNRFEVENVGGTVTVLLLLARVVDWRRGIDRHSFLPFLRTP